MYESIVTFILMTLSTMGLTEILSRITFSMEYHRNVMLSVIMLSVIMLSVFMMSVFMLRVIMLSVIMLSVIKLSVIMLSVIILTVMVPFQPFKIGQN